MSEGYAHKTAAVHEKSGKIVKNEKHKERELEDFLYASDKQRLIELVQEMAEGAGRLLNDAVQSLADADTKIAQSVIDGDDSIDEMEEKIDKECLYSIAMRQPMREDLRFAYAVVKIVTDIERIGDQSVNIAKCSLEMYDANGESMYFSAGKPVIDAILLMRERVEIMISTVLKAFVDGDEKAALDVISNRPAFRQIGEDAVNGLVSFMGTDNSSNVIKVFTNTLWIVRHLDRVSEHIINLAERVCFVVTGISPDALKNKIRKISV